MALKSDDSDLNKTWLQTHFGGNGDYYLTIISEDHEGIKSTNTVRIAMSGGFTPRESNIKLLVSQLHWEMEKFNLNEYPDND
jgi:hypothetical protein